MSDITVITDSQQSELVTNGLAKNGELYLKAAGSTNAGAIVAYDSGSWRTFANEASLFSNTYSVSFDGTNDFMDLGSSNIYANTANAFSISAWFKYDTFNNYPTFIQLKTNRTYGFKLATSQSGSYKGVWFGSADSTGFKGFSTNNATLATSMATGWHHIVYTYDGVDSRSASSSAVYIDGSPVTCTTAVGIGSYANTNKVGFGQSSTFAFDGLMDEVAIFNSELSSSAVSAIYNSGVPADLTSYSPLGWWRMGDNDSGTGTTITDQGSGSNNGTLTNGPTFSTTVPS